MCVSDEDMGWYSCVPYVYIYMYDGALCCNSNTVKKCDSWSVWLATPALNAKRSPNLFIKEVAMDTPVLMQFQWKDQFVIQTVWIAL